MFHALSQAVGEAIGPVAQFGVAGLMGGLWWWERKCSRQREEQLTENAVRIGQLGKELFERISVWSAHLGRMGDALLDYRAVSTLP